MGKRVEQRHGIFSQLCYFEKGHRELREWLFHCEMVSSIALSFLSSNLTEEGASRAGIKTAERNSPTRGRDDPLTVVCDISGCRRGSDMVGRSETNDEETLL